MADIAAGKLHREGSSLEELPLDVLLGIFDFLDLQALTALAATCRKFYTTINDEYLSFKSSSLLVTNQYSAEIQKRSLLLLSSLKKYHTNRRWRNKCYTERSLLKSREKFRPWLSLTEHGLFMGRGKHIKLYGCNRRGINTEPAVTFKGHSDDISRFVIRDNFMISSGNDGMLCCWDVHSGKALYKAITAVGWNESVYADWSNGVLAVGYNLAGRVNFHEVDGTGFVPKHEIQQDDRVWSVALNFEGTSCSIGSAGYRSPPIKIYDINRGAYTLSIPENYKTGAGVFHTIWETPQILISASYDTYVRMWDLRTGDCVSSWSDPYDTAVYSLATDHHCTILAGTSLHGRVTLWDKRLPRCVQMYYMSCGDGGPVYSLDFDPSYMFVALESSLHVLDFSQPLKSTSFKFTTWR